MLGRIGPWKVIAGRPTNAAREVWRGGFSFGTETVSTVFIRDGNQTWVRFRMQEAEGTYELRRRDGQTIGDDEHELADASSRIGPHFAVRVADSGRAPLTITYPPGAADLDVEDLTDEQRGWLLRLLEPFGRVDVVPKQVIEQLINLELLVQNGPNRVNATIDGRRLYQKLGGKDALGR